MRQGSGGGSQLLQTPPQNGASWTGDTSLPAATPGGEAGGGLSKDEVLRRKQDCIAAPQRLFASGQPVPKVGGGCCVTVTPHASYQFLPSSFLLRQSAC
jgi:hypothetical protein